jgi:succinate-semialdehyde dehydrogenase/glutarate-semialdehyde dehydrogenase
VEGHIARAVAEGATVRIGGGRPADLTTGWYVEPTLLTHVSNDMAVAQEEIFGPVTVLIGYEDEEDAIRIANDSPFGLGGSVFTANVQRGAEVAAKISTGMVFVNHPTMVKADLPFGGVRRSGYGRELLGLGINEFVNHKLIDIVDIEAVF